MRDPGRADARVLMWRMDAPQLKGATWIGALEDGTIFQRLGPERWTTVIAGPTDIDESYELVVEMTRRCEDRMVMLGPVEFAIEEILADCIRKDTGWQQVEIILMIGFDMALRARR